MVYLKGKGAMTGVNLIAKVYDNGATKDGKSHYADIQVDARDERAKGQTNLNLKSEKVQTPDGKQRYNNSAPYSKGQMEEIVAAAGPNKEPLLDKDGNAVGTVYGFKGSVMPATRGTGLVVNTKKVEQGDFKVDKDTIANQFAAMREAKAARDAAQAEQPSAEVEQTAQAEQVAEVEQEEPAVG